MIFLMKIFYLLFFQIVAVMSLNAQAEVSKDPPVSNKDSVRIHVEAESYFPGGVPAWIRFLNNNLTYPPKAVRKKVEGTVVVQFIVDKNGALSNIEAISGPELLQEAAVNVIKNSPNWKPAIQDGRIVKSYKKQPITFKLQQ
jgi:periplasmic protein TonB